MAAEKTCFVICPIGEPETAIRDRSDKLLKHIITPAVVAHGYAEPTRADHIDEAGTITRQIIDRVHDADLVVADLTDLNPNVFYELAVRQAFHKPVIVIGLIGTKIPFDVAHQRMVPYGLDLDSAAEAKERISEQARRFAGGEPAGDSPISHAASLRAISSANKASAGDLGGALDVILSEIGRLRRETREAVASLEVRVTEVVSRAAAQSPRLADLLRQPRAGAIPPPQGLGTMLTSTASEGLGLAEEKNAAEALSLIKKKKPQE